MLSKPLAIMGMIAASMTLAGCAQGQRPVAATTLPAMASITIAVGPCFGFCPVYSARVTPDGTVLFNGERHTQLLGEKRRKAGAGLYGALERDLAAYRPADGSTQPVACDAAISDTSTYTITWRKPDGTEAVATHHSHCRGGPGHDLDLVLQAMPQRLGIAAWAKQVTRPGASRG